jgi:hypothetical protein
MPPKLGGAGNRAQEYDLEFGKRGRYTVWAHRYGVQPSSAIYR